MSSAAPAVKPPRPRSNARRVSATRSGSRRRRRPRTRRATGRQRAHPPKRRPSRPRPRAEAGAMAEISAKDIAALRKQTGAGVLDCRTALGGTVGDAVKQLGATVGENVGIGRVARIESAEGIVDGYKHVQNERGTIGVLVELGGVDPSAARAQEIAHDVALHIASAAPQYVTRDDVPADVLEKERAVLEELTRNEGKPEQALPKIVEGRLNGFYKNTVLVEQPFVRDPKTTIGKLVRELGKDAAIRRFVRIQVGAE